MNRTTVTYVKKARVLVLSLFAALFLLGSTAVAQEVRIYSMLAKEVQDVITQ